VGALDRNAPGGRRFLTLDAVPEFCLGPIEGPRYLETETQSPDRLPQSESRRAEMQAR